MKQTLFIFLLTIVIGSAALFTYAFAAPPGYRYDMSMEKLNIHHDIDPDRIDKILLWMNDNLSYKTDGSNGEDYWQTPGETVLAGGGDCEDLSLLFMYLLNEKLNLSSTLLLVRVNGGSAVSHAIVESDGQWYDLTTGGEVPFKDQFSVAFRIPYSRSMYSAERFHRWEPFQGFSF